MSYTVRRRQIVSDEIGFGDDGESRAESGRTPQLVPMRVGNATVLVEQVAWRGNCCGNKKKLSW
jgi:hypothetical protein